MIHLSIPSTNSFLNLFVFFIVVLVQLSPFSPHHAPHPPQTYPLWLCPYVLYTCSLMALPLISPIILLSPPLWLLSVCSLFQCLWFYFACLFVLSFKKSLLNAKYMSRTVVRIDEIPMSNIDEAPTCSLMEDIGNEPENDFTHIWHLMNKLK